MDLNHSNLVEIAFKWVMRKAGCGVALKELYSLNREIPDVIGFSTTKSVLVECKASRADFLSDRAKWCRTDDIGMGMFRFYICPEELIKIEELPDNWGLIYVNGRGHAKCVHNPYNPKGGNIWSNPHQRNLEAEMRIMYAALRIKRS